MYRQAKAALCWLCSLHTVVSVIQEVSIILALSGVIVHSVCHYYYGHEQECPKRSTAVVAV